MVQLTVLHRKRHWQDMGPSKHTFGVQMLSYQLTIGSICRGLHYVRMGAGNTAVNSQGE